MALSQSSLSTNESHDNPGWKHISWSRALLPGNEMDIFFADLNKNLFGSEVYYGNG
jgi:hypothetical protein